MRPAMRVSNHRARRVLALALAAGLIVGCGCLRQPRPPQREPGAADRRAHPGHHARSAPDRARHGRPGLQRDPPGCGLPLSVNNATAGGPNSPLIKQINAQVANWPLVISEYRSAAPAPGAVGMGPGAGPRQGDRALRVGRDEHRRRRSDPSTGVLAAPDADAPAAGQGRWSRSSTRSCGRWSSAR